MNNALLFEDRVEKCLFPVLNKYSKLFATNGITLSYQFRRFGDYSDIDYTSEMELAIVKIIEGKIIDYIDHIDFFVMLRNQENVDLETLPQRLEKELKLIWDSLM